VRPIEARIASAARAASRRAWSVECRPGAPLVGGGCPPGRARRLCHCASLVIRHAALAFLALLAWGCGAGNPGEERAATAPVRVQILLNRIAQDPADVEAHLALANAYYDADRPHLAIPHYQEVLTHRPDDADVRTDLGTCYKRIGDLDRAAAEYERVRREHPDHPQAAFNLAVVSDLAGHHERAADLWEQAARLAPGTDLARLATAYAADARRQPAAPPTTAPSSLPKEMP
jgi:tetratricopeptide (TPR) repeat protein